MKRIIAGCGVLMLFLWAAPEVGVAPTAAMAQQEQGPYQPLEYGDQGDTVTLVQQQLSALGYYSGKVSGNFLDGTRAAVKRFQKDYGLQETGIVDGETEALLFSAEYRSLSLTSEGADVTRLQEYLSIMGYFAGQATGKYGEQTTAAVMAFQENNGLDATGEADVETQRKLFGGQALAKDGSFQTPDPNVDMGDINDVVMVEDGANSDALLEASEYGGKLKRGAKGENVKLVQQRLTELGFFDGPISGNYMNQTMDAVKAFQTMHGLKADGITGQETWEQMFNSADVLDASATPRPTPVPTPVPYAVTVDVRNQVVWVYGRDAYGDYTVPVRNMICSTGMKATPSDVGEWVTNGRRARWCYFSLYGSHGQYWTRINSNIAFHSVIYNRVDYMALSVKSYNLLGQRASHGCIRLLVSEAQWIYENIREGTVVTVTESLPEDQELRKSLQPPPLNKQYMRPVNTPEPTPVPDYTTDGVPSGEPRKLKKGSSGEDVYWLQCRLRDLGYYEGTVTGSFYNGTANAVKAFQKDNGLRGNGEATLQTLEALYAIPVVTPTPRPTPTPSPTPSPSPTPAPTLTPEPTPTPEMPVITDERVTLYQDGNIPEED